jgi:hypothetical protein
MGTGDNYDPRLTPSVARRSARDYNRDVGRVYEENLSVGIPAPVGRTLHTESFFPIVTGVDLTGSMRKNPIEIFKRLGRLSGESLLYMPDREMCFIGIGDAYTDKHPIQIGEFGRDRDIERPLNSIYKEGGGGGQGMETYELVAYYLVNHCEIPNAKTPICVFIGDEGFYPKVSREHVRKYTGDRIPEDLDSMEVMKKLEEKFNTYILRLDSTAHYYNPSLEDRIQKQWEEALGKDNVKKITNAERVVDVLLYEIADITGKRGTYIERTGVQQADHVEELVQILHPNLTESEIKELREKAEKTLESEKNKTGESGG